MIDSGGFELLARRRLDDISAPALGRPRADLVRGTYPWADAGTLLKKLDSKSGSGVCMQASPQRRQLCMAVRSHAVSGDTEG